MKQKKVEEFRYYEMPVGRFDRALLGENGLPLIGQENSIFIIFLR